MTNSEEKSQQFIVDLLDFGEQAVTGTYMAVYKGTKAVKGSKFKFITTLVDQDAIAKHLDDYFDICIKAYESKSEDDVVKKIDNLLTYKDSNYQALFSHIKSLAQTLNNVFIINILKEDILQFADELGEDDLRMSILTIVQMGSLEILKAMDDQ